MVRAIFQVLANALINALSAFVLTLLKSSFVIAVDFLIREIKPLWSLHVIIHAILAPNIALIVLGYEWSAKFFLRRDVTPPLFHAVLIHRLFLPYAKHLIDVWQKHEMDIK